MRQSSFRTALIFSFILLPGSLAFAQDQHATEPNPDSNLTPDQFTNTVKEAWIFLKNETEAFLNSTAKKTEFETSQEFEKRVADARKQFLDKVVKFSADKKFDKREFGVLFKANLVAYDADTQTYTIASGTVVEIPYDIPFLQVSMENNALVALVDSVARGYRSTSMYLKTKPPLRFEVPRDLAKTVKNDEGDLYFRVTVTVNMIQENFKNEALIRMEAHHITLFHRKNNLVYWEQNL